jgi:hypothetical protein
MSLYGGLTKVRSETVSCSIARADLLCVVLTNRFPDDQVLMGTFVQELEKVVRILRPFVHW